MIKASRVLRSFGSNRQRFLASARILVGNHCIPPFRSKSNRRSFDSFASLRWLRMTETRGTGRSDHDRCGSGAQSIPRVRSSHVSGARPASTRTMVMHSSTGQTREHRLQPTHSVSSTRGMRASGVDCRLCAASRSLRVTGVKAIAPGCGPRLQREWNAALRGRRWGRKRGRDECTGEHRPSRQCGIDRSQCTSSHRCARRFCNSGSGASLVTFGSERPRKSSMVLKPLERIQLSSPRPYLRQCGSRGA